MYAAEDTVLSDLDADADAAEPTTNLAQTAHQRKFSAHTCVKTS